MGVETPVRIKLWGRGLNHAPHTLVRGQSAMAPVHCAPRPPFPSVAFSSGPAVIYRRPRARGPERPPAPPLRRAGTAPLACGGSLCPRFIFNSDIKAYICQIFFLARVLFPIPRTTPVGHHPGGGMPHPLPPVRSLGPPAGGPGAAWRASSGSRRPSGASPAPRVCAPPDPRLQEGEPLDPFTVLWAFLPPSFWTSSPPVAIPAATAPPGHGTALDTHRHRVPSRSPSFTDPSIARHPPSNLQRFLSRVWIKNRLRFFSRRQRRCHGSKGVAKAYGVVFFYSIQKLTSYRASMVGHEKIEKNGEQRQTRPNDQNGEKK